MTEVYNYTLEISTSKQDHLITSKWNTFIELYDKSGKSTSKILIGLDSKMNGVSLGNKFQNNCVQDLGFTTFESNTISMCYFQTTIKIEEIDKINIGYDIDKNILNKIIKHSWNISKVRLNCIQSCKSFVFEIKQPITNNLFLSISRCKIIENTIQFKPIVIFRNCNNKNWSISLLLVLSSNNKYPPYLFFEDENLNKIVSNKVVILKYCFSKTLIRYDVELPMSNNEIKWKYSYLSFDYSKFNESFIYVPKIKSSPNIFFASCLGICPTFCRQDGLDDAFVGFEYAYRNHLKNSYHLAIYGGDQIYADSLFTACPSLRKWTYLKEKERIKFIPTDEMLIELDVFYFNLYFNTWGQKYINNFLSSVSSIMMWDDHDIINGYGSRKNYPVLEAIYIIARQNFILFQLGGHCNPGFYCHNPEISLQINEKNRYQSLTYTRRISDIGFLILDTRSQRDINTIINKQNYIELQNKYLGKFGEEINKSSPFYLCKHLYVIIGVPLIFFPHVSEISEKILKIVPGEQEAESDIGDQWKSKNHLEERNNLISILINFANLNNIKVTLLTGDSHIGSCGIIKNKNEEIIIEQPISSGIGSQAPSNFITDAYKLVNKTNIINSQTKINDICFTEYMKNLVIIERNFLTIINNKISFTTFKNNVDLNNLSLENKIDL